jgi:hypothetical protein
MGWLNVLEAHKDLGLEMPVNLKMIFEGMEESGSVNLDKFIESEKDKFFAGLDCMCISDNYWLDTKTPCLTYGLRGVNYYEIKVSGPDRDLHSGVFGGTIHEPMTDLIILSEYNWRRGLGGGRVSQKELVGAGIAVEDSASCLPSPRLSSRRPGDLFHSSLVRWRRQCQCRCRGSGRKGHLHCSLHPSPRPSLPAVLLPVAR